MPAPADRKPWLRRIGWLMLIWIASVGALAVVAVLFRLLMSMAGMTV
ncbi:DUF2474 domain-containing protein [Pseudochelatococcus sp. B33]